MNILTAVVFSAKYVYQLLKQFRFDSCPRYCYFPYVPLSSTQLPHPFVHKINKAFNVNGRLSIFTNQRTSNFCRLSEIFLYPIHFPVFVPQRQQATFLRLCDFGHSLRLSTSLNVLKLFAFNLSILIMLFLNIFGLFWRRCCQSCFGIRVNLRCIFV